jgi:hypothetical protein
LFELSIHPIISKEKMSTVKMAWLDIFILKKVKNLMTAGRNANLNIKVNTGKANVKLSIELGHPASGDQPLNTGVTIIAPKMDKHGNADD